MKLQNVLSVREAAVETGVPERRIRALIREGRLRIIRIGYHLLIPRCEMRKVLENVNVK